MALSKPRSRVLVVSGIVLLLVGLGLGWWAWGGDADGRDGRAATVGLLIGVSGITLTVAGWFLPSKPSGRGTSQRAGRRSVQAGRDITGAVASGSRATATMSEPPSPSTTSGESDHRGQSSGSAVEQRGGVRGVQAGGSITGAVATGDSAQATEGTSVDPQEGS